MGPKKQVGGDEIPPFTKGNKVIFMTDNGPYRGIVQRVTGDMITIKATGPLQQNRRRAVIPEVPEKEMYIVHKGDVKLAR